MIHIIYTLVNFIFYITFILPFNIFVTIVAVVAIKMEKPKPIMQKKPLRLTAKEKEAIYWRNKLGFTVSDLV